MQSAYLSLTPRTVSLACMLLMSMSGCMTTPPGHVVREWSTTIRELGITPIFPPREDVQVGDIYMAPIVPDEEKAVLKSKGYLPLGLWVGTATIKKDISKFYSERSSFPVTSKTGSDQPRTTGTDVLMDTDKQRLRLVGFPMFMSTSLSSGSLSGLIPAEAVGVAASAGFTMGRRVTVSIPRAESYAVPAAVLLNKLTAAAESEDRAQKKWSVLGSGGFNPEDIDIYLPTEQKTILSKNRLWHENKYGYVRVITEVFYARELDITIESSRGAGFAFDARPSANLGVSLPVASNAASSSPVAAPNALPDGDTGASGTPPPPAVAPAVQFQQPTPQQIAAELNRQLDEGMQRSTPSVGARFVSAGNNGVGLRVTFERPIAVGYRGMLLKVFKDGTIEGAGSIGSAVPTAAPTPPRI